MGPNHNVLLSKEEQQQNAFGVEQQIDQQQSFQQQNDPFLTQQMQSQGEAGLLSGMQDHQQMDLSQVSLEGERQQIIPNLSIDANRNMQSILLNSAHQLDVREESAEHDELNLAQLDIEIDEDVEVVEDRSLNSVLRNLQSELNADKEWASDAFNAVRTSMDDLVAKMQDARSTDRTRGKALSRLHHMAMAYYNARRGSRWSRKGERRKNLVERIIDTTLNAMVSDEMSDNLREVALENLIADKSKEGFGSKKVQDFFRQQAQKEANSDKVDATSYMLRFYASMQSRRNGLIDRQLNISGKMQSGEKAVSAAALNVLDLYYRVDKDGNPIAQSDADKKLRLQEQVDRMTNTDLNVRKEYLNDCFQRVLNFEFAPEMMTEEYVLAHYQQMQKVSAMAEFFRQNIDKVPDNLAYYKSLPVEARQTLEVNRGYLDVLARFVSLIENKHGINGDGTYAATRQLGGADSQALEAMGNRGHALYKDFQKGKTVSEKRLNAFEEMLNRPDVVGIERTQGYLQLEAIKLTQSLHKKPVPGMDLQAVIEADKAREQEIASLQYEDFVRMVGTLNRGQAEYSDEGRLQVINNHRMDAGKKGTYSTDNVKVRCRFLRCIQEKLGNDLEEEDLARIRKTLELDQENDYALPISREVIHEIVSFVGLRTSKVDKHLHNMIGRENEIVEEDIASLVNTVTGEDLNANSRANPTEKMIEALKKHFRELMEMPKKYQGHKASGMAELPKLSDHQLGNLARNITYLREELFKNLMTAYRRASHFNNGGFINSDHFRYSIMAQSGGIERNGVMYDFFRIITLTIARVAAETEEGQIAADVELEKGIEAFAFNQQDTRIFIDEYCGAEKNPKYGKIELKQADFHALSIPEVAEGAAGLMEAASQKIRGKNESSEKNRDYNAALDQGMLHMSELFENLKIVSELSTKAYLDGLTTEEGEQIKEAGRKAEALLTDAEAMRQMEMVARQLKGTRFAAGFKKLQNLQEMETVLDKEKNEVTKKRLDFAEMTEKIDGIMVCNGRHGYGHLKGERDATYDRMMGIEEKLREAKETAPIREYFNKFAALNDREAQDVVEILLGQGSILTQIQLAEEAARKANKGTVPEGVVQQYTEGFLKIHDILRKCADQPGEDIIVEDVTIGKTKVRLIRRRAGAFELSVANQTFSIPTSAKLLADRMEEDIAGGVEYFPPERIRESYARIKEEARKEPIAGASRQRDFCSRYLSALTGQPRAYFNNITHAYLVQLAEECMSGDMNAEAVVDAVQIVMERTDMQINGQEVLENFKRIEDQRMNVELKVFIHHPKAFKERDSEDWTEEEEKVKNLLADMIFAENSRLQDLNNEEPGQALRHILASHSTTLLLLIEKPELLETVLQKMPLLDENVSKVISDNFKELLANQGSNAMKRVREQLLNLQEESLRDEEEARKDEEEEAKAQEEEQRLAKEKEQQEKEKNEKEQQKIEENPANEEEIHQESEEEKKKRQLEAGKKAFSGFLAFFGVKQSGSEEKAPEKTEEVKKERPKRGFFESPPAGFDSWDDYDDLMETNPAKAGRIQRKAERKARAEARETRRNLIRGGMILTLKNSSDEGMKETFAELDRTISGAVKDGMDSLQQQIKEAVQGIFPESQQEQQPEQDAQKKEKRKYKSVKEKTMAEIEEEGRQLNRIVQESASSDKGQGKFMKNVLTTYFTRSSEVDKRAMMAAALRNAKPRRQQEEPDENGQAERKAAGQMLGGVLKGAGPLLQKMMQGLPTTGMPEEIQEALKDMKSNLAPIPDEIVQYQLAGVVERSQGAIERIEVERSLGAASVAQAFLCKMYGPGMEEGRSVVVKILRPDALNRMQREKKVIMDAAIATGPGMASTYEGQLARIEEEFDLSLEAKNAEMGRMYDRDYTTLQAVKVVGNVASNNGILVMEQAEGETVDKYMSNTRQACREDLEPFYEKGSDMNPTEMKIDSSNIMKVKEAQLRMQERLNQMQKRQKYLVQLAETWVKEAVFGKGFYHGDLHAGNIMISDRRATVIDFGNVTRLTEEQQVQITRMIAAATTADKDGFKEGFYQLIDKEKHGETFKQVEKELDEAFEEVFNLGCMNHAGPRIAAALMKAQDLGLELPAAIFNFSQAQIRLANAIEEMNQLIEEMHQQVNALDNVKNDGTGPDYEGCIDLEMAYAEMLQSESFIGAQTYQTDKLKAMDPAEDGTYKSGTAASVEESKMLITSGRQLKKDKADTYKTEMARKHLFGEKPKLKIPPSEGISFKHDMNYRDPEVGARVIVTPLDMLGEECNLILNEHESGTLSADEMKVALEKFMGQAAGLYVDYKEDEFKGLQAQINEYLAEPQANADKLQTVISSVREMIREIEKRIEDTVQLFKIRRGAVQPKDGEPTKEEAKTLSEKSRDELQKRGRTVAVMGLLMDHPIFTAVAETISNPENQERVEQTLKPWFEDKENHGAELEAAYKEYRQARDDKSDDCQIKRFRFLNLYRQAVIFRVKNDTKAKGKFDNIHGRFSHPKDFVDAMGNTIGSNYKSAFNRLGAKGIIYGVMMKKEEDALSQKK